MKLKLILLPILFVASTAKAELLVVASTESALVHLSPSEVKTLFLGNPILGGSVDYRPLERINPTDPNLKNQFLEVIMSMRPGELKAYWSRKIFTGRGTPPQEAKTVEQLRDSLGKEPNLVTYVSRNEFDPKTMKLLLEVK
jgi:hypothetical protein